MLAVIKVQVKVIKTEGTKFERVFPSSIITRANNKNTIKLRMTIINFNAKVKIEIVRIEYWNSRRYFTFIMKPFH